MTMKETLAEKKQALIDLEPMLSAEDVSDETIVKGEELVKEIADLEVKIANAEKASKVLDTIGSTEEKTNDMGEQKMSQMEDFTKKCAEMTDKKAGARVHFEKAYRNTCSWPCGYGGWSCPLLPFLSLYRGMARFIGFYIRLCYSHGLFYPAGRFVCVG